MRDAPAALMRETESRDYASQATYAHGGVMCTTAAVYWALSCVCNIVQPMCSVVQMQLLMKTSAETHNKILNKRASNLAETLQQHEVLRCIAQPCAVHADELYGYCTDKNADMAPFLHLGDIYSLVEKGESLLLTGGGHTTALHRDEAGVLYMYDSLPARVCAQPSVSALTASLLTAHRHMDQFTATHLHQRTVRNAQPQQSL